MGPLKISIFSALSLFTALSLSSFETAKAQSSDNSNQRISAEPKHSASALLGRSIGPQQLQAYKDKRTHTIGGLPGGVMLTLSAERTNEDTLRILKKLAALGVDTSEAKAIIGDQVWLLPSAPGQASVELANRIHERLFDSKGFIGAEPNWWRDRRRK